MPEQSISDKVNYYKGIAKTVRKRMENLEKRVQVLEQKLSKIYTKPDDVKCIKSDVKKNSRKEFMNKWIADGGTWDDSDEEDK